VKQKINVVLDVILRVCLVVTFVPLVVLYSLMTYLGMYSLQPNLNSSQAYIAGFFLALAAFFASYSRGLEGEHAKVVHRRSGYIALGGMVLAMAALLFTLMLLADKANDSPVAAEVRAAFFTVGIYLDSALTFIGLLVAANSLFYLAHYLCFGHRSKYQFANSIFFVEHFALGFLAIFDLKTVGGSKKQTQEKSDPPKAPQL
jgi:hypothetical protein